MGEIVNFDAVTKVDLDAQVILEKALAAGLKNAIVIGEMPSGTVYFAMSMSDAPLINWLLDCAKKSIIDESCPIGDE